MEQRRNTNSALCPLSCQACSSSPFTTRLLARPWPPTADELLSLLPASYRTKSDDLVSASGDVGACLEIELDLQRLSRVFHWLWVAGRPMPPRPLHYQILLSRDIFVTERMDMHLVWTAGRMFVKPLPRFLLEPHFWSYISCAISCRCHEGGGVQVPKPAKRIPEPPPPACTQKRWKCAVGFLFSYAALITHESDFFIAKEKHLLPEEVTWPAWRTFVQELDTEHIYPSIDPRFVYGELRLSRLNKIYFLSQTPLRGYMAQWQQYGAFFRDNLTWLASAIVYITIVLTAMQVGLATNALSSNHSFQSVSYGFTVFSILGPLLAFGLIVMAFCYMFVDNWIAAAAYKNHRFRHAGLKKGPTKS